MKLFERILGAVIILLAVFVGGVQTGFVVQRDRDARPVTLHAKYVPGYYTHDPQFVSCTDNGTPAPPPLVTGMTCKTSGFIVKTWHPAEWVFTDDAGREMQIRVRGNKAEPFYPQPDSWEHQP